MLVMVMMAKKMMTNGMAMKNRHDDCDKNTDDSDGNDGESGASFEA